MFSGYVFCVSYCGQKCDLASFFRKSDVLQGAGWFCHLKKTDAADDQTVVFFFQGTKRTAAECGACSFAVRYLPDSAAK